MNGRYKLRLLGWAVVLLWMQCHTYDAIRSGLGKNVSEKEYRFELLNPGNGLSNNLLEQRPGPRVQARTPHHLSFFPIAEDWIWEIQIRDCCLPLAENDYLYTTEPVPLRFSSTDIIFPFHHFG